MKRRLLVKIVTALGLAMLGCAPRAYKITPVSADEKLLETTVTKDAGILLPKIALIDIQGLLTNSRKQSLLGEAENPTALTVEKLEKAARDRSVKAVVIRINSPGGTVTASDILYRQILKVRKGTKRHPGKPVIAMIMDLGASGGYYIACAADEIIAEPTSVTGSIGVVMLNFDAKGLLDKIGIRTDAIKSGDKKDAGSPFRPLEPDEREIFQKLIDEFYGNFIEVVAKSRTALSREKIRKLADGRIYSGRQAKELDLVDRTGGLDLAIERAKASSNIKSARVVMYHRPIGYRGTIYADAASPPARFGQFNLLNLTVPDIIASQGCFLYLWQP